MKWDDFLVTLFLAGRGGVIKTQRRKDGYNADTKQIYISSLLDASGRNPESNSSKKRLAIARRLGA